MTYHNIKQYAAFSDGFDLRLNLRVFTVWSELLMIMFDDDPLWLIFWRHLRIFASNKTLSHAHTWYVGISVGALMVTAK